ncbi:MAG: AmmeMemoRadiSam system radical SAM enzyme [Acidobacteria bacterium]|nr:AmmeMemoRadiSam system radical SAM enzyme [Acidobacteriota bacterium]
MTLAAELTRLSSPTSLCESLPDHHLRCLACAHRCHIAPGQSGICKVRTNRDGALLVPHGYVNALHSDPIEKKPFFHALPGSRAMSFGMLGCDLHCAYCQNWLSSQALRDPSSIGDVHEIEPAQLVQSALRAGASSVISTYNEPMITAEWAIEIFRCARAAGLATGFVSNGYATPNVLRALHPHLDLLKIDLKSFDDRRYRELGGKLQPVLDTIRHARSLGLWMEVVTLLVPGLNDSLAELRSLTAFLASVSPEIPWHVTAFHPDYKMLASPPTTTAALVQAVAIGRQAGLRFVYAGNLTGHTDGLEHTRCPVCSTLIIERHGFQVLHNRVTSAGTCPSCHHPLPGFWRIARREHS